MDRFGRALAALGVAPASSFRRYLATVVGCTTVIASLVWPAGVANAATLSSVSVALSDPRPSVSSNYSFTGSGVTLSAIKCIKEVYATTATGSTAPTGISTTGGVTLSASSNYIPTPASWTLANGTNGTVTLTNASGETPASASARTVILNGITNSSVVDANYWLTITTYGSTDCATSPVDTAQVQFINTNGSTLSLTIDNTLSFTVNAVGSSASCDGTTTTAASTATTIPFGTATASSNNVVCQDLTAATNATNGYTIYTRYTAKPTNAISQTIADWTGSNTAPTTFSAAGTEAYGYTTNDAVLGTGTANRFVNGGQKWAAETTGNAEVAYEAAGVTSTTYRIGHQVGISLTTHPGTYSTTIIYTCTPIY